MRSMLLFLCAAALACGCTYPTLVLLDGGIDGAATDATTGDATTGDAATGDATTGDATTGDAATDAAALAAVPIPAAAPDLVRPLGAPVAFGVAAVRKKSLQHAEIAGQNPTSQGPEGQFLEAAPMM